MSTLLVNFKEMYGGDNDVSKYLESKIGNRFMVIKDVLCGYVGLFDKQFLNYPIMSNSNHEKLSNAPIVDSAKGEVLIAGLGIGLILLPIMNKPEVTSIDVVELHEEVIDIVAKQLPLLDKVNIIHQNIFTFKPERKYDTIYFDTVPYEWNVEVDKKSRQLGDKILSDDNISDIYSKYLKDGGHISHFIPAVEAK